MNSRLLFLLIALVAAWALALNTGRDIVFSLAYLLTAALLLSALWAWINVRGLAIRRTTPTRRSQVGH